MTDLPCWFQVAVGSVGGCVLAALLASGGLYLVHGTVYLWQRCRGRSPMWVPMWEDGKVLVTWATVAGLVVSGVVVGTQVIASMCQDCEAPGTVIPG